MNCLVIQWRGNKYLSVIIRKLKKLQLSNKNKTPGSNSTNKYSEAHELMFLGNFTSCLVPTSVGLGYITVGTSSSPSHFLCMCAFEASHTHSHLPRVAEWFLTLCQNPIVSDLKSLYTKTCLHNTGLIKMLKAELMFLQGTCGSQQKYGSLVRQSNLLSVFVGSPGQAWTHWTTRA